MIETLASQVVSGLATGCIYALVALGFVLIFKATDVVNFAQGEFIMASGFMSYTLLIWGGLPYWLVLLITIPLSGLMGVILERIVVRPIMDAPIFSIVIATIGASTIMRSAAALASARDDVAQVRYSRSGTFVTSRRENQDLEPTDSSASAWATLSTASNECSAPVPA